MAKNLIVSRLVNQYTKIFTPLIFLIVQGCSETTIGKRLASSFDNTGPNINPEKPSNNSRIKESPPKLDTIPRESEPILIKKKEKVIKTYKTEKFVESKPLLFKPLPYRVTIKLSGTNPSAPAEAVTKALRRAGIQFEVESIERVNILLKEEKSLRNGVKR